MSPLQASLSSGVWHTWVAAREEAVREFLSETHLIFVFSYTNFLDTKFHTQKHWEKTVTWGCSTGWSCQKYYWVSDQTCSIKTNRETVTLSNRKQLEKFFGKSDVEQGNKYPDTVTLSNTIGCGQKWLRHSCRWKPLGRAHNRVEATAN